MTTKIGIFGGTFDPIHDGHVAFAKAAAKVCKLEKVVFLPETQPRQKQQVSPLPARVRQITATIRPHPQLEVLELKTSHFTIAETLPTLQKIFPDIEFAFLVGSDVALNLHTWPYIDRLLNSSLAIGLRSGQSEKQIDDYIKRLEGNIGHTIDYQIIRSPHSDKASSQYRKPS